jgi:nucleolar complex protein 3
MSELLSSQPHFNFSENIMGVLVGRIGRRSWDEVSASSYLTLLSADR